MPNRAEQPTSRPLEISDFASQQYPEILAHPDEFLGLPPNCRDIPLIRRTYINLARRYHPDMTKQELDPALLLKRYSAADFALVDKKVLAVIQATPETALAQIVAIFVTLDRIDDRLLRQAEYATQAIRAAAHQKMVQINIAYEAIKKRFPPEQWNSPSTYIETAKAYQGEPATEILLEANARLAVFSTPYQHWLPGAWLSFDQGPQPDRPWRTIFRHVIMVKHLYIYLEMQEGRSQISPALLATFFHHFQFTDQQQTLFIRLLLERQPATVIMAALGLENDRQAYDRWQDTNDEAGEDAWLSALKLRRYINEMLTLCQEPEWLQGAEFQEDPVSLHRAGDQLVLSEFGDTILSEADQTLLATLAYGPMLKSECR
jgi:hypothetical protein